MSASVQSAPDLLGTPVFAVGPPWPRWRWVLAWDILTPPRFVGLDNYRQLLFDDPVFRQVVVNNTHTTPGHGASSNRCEALPVGQRKLVELLASHIAAPRVHQAL
jgi:hypothetical protein